MTSALLCDNPRVVKEADALAAAGCDVRVVAYAPGRADAEREAATRAGRRWRATLVPVRFDRSDSLVNRARLIARHVVQSLSRIAWRGGARQPSIADHAASRHLSALVAAAVAEPADLFVAHNVPALPAAARAATRRRALLAFDAEDLHSAEHPTDDARTALTVAVEGRYLPRCAAVTASSPGIAAALSQRYGIAAPHVVLNTFPYADAPALGETLEEDRPRSLYWVSQVIGLDRGVQDAIRALPHLRGAAELHLRGRVTDAVKAELCALANANGVGDQLHFHPIASPDELTPLAAIHDVGLALEPPVNGNRLVCIPNKLLQYFAAGLAVAAADLPGQRWLMNQAPDAGFLYPPGDYEALAAGLNELLWPSGSLAFARTAARRAAAKLLSWEAEAPALVDYIVSQLRMRAVVRSAEVPG